MKEKEMIELMMVVDNEKKPVNPFVLNKQNYNQSKEGWYWHNNPPNKYELQLGEMVKKKYSLKNEELVFNERLKIAPFELDIWIPKLNIAYELQGPHHYKKEYKYTVQVNDLFKKNISKHNFTLITIPIFLLNEDYVIDEKTPKQKKDEEERLKLKQIWKLRKKRIKQLKKQQVNEDVINS